METFFLNDKFVAGDKILLSSKDRGLLLGDGLFETIRIFSGHPLFLKMHWQRLTKSSKLLNLPIKIAYKEIKDIIYKLVKLNNLESKDASIRITITRGPGPRGISIPDKMKPTVIITCAQHIITSQQTWTAQISTIKRNEHSFISQVKSLNYLDNIFARMEAQKAGADEALLSNTANNISCASCANIFVVFGQELHTPPVSDGALPGITRKQVLAIAKEIGLKTHTSSIPIDSLFHAEEIFLTNSLIGIKPITMLNGKSFNSDATGNITNQLSDNLQKYYETFLAKEEYQHD